MRAEARSRRFDPGAVLRKAASWELTAVVTSTVVLIVVMSLTSPGFSQPFNVESLLATIAVTGTVALAQMAVLAVGHFNLALASIGALVGMVFGWLLQSAGVPWELAVVVALLLGAFLGSLQGALIVGFGLNALIVTLGLASVYGGLTFVIFGSQRFQELPLILTDVGNGSIRALPGFPIPYIVAIAIAGWLAVLCLVACTVYGRRLLATGANGPAAALSGLRTGRITVGAHALSGLLTAFAAVLLVTRLAVASPEIGQDWLLPSFAACVLGGTALTGGRVSVFGAVVGALLLAVVANALVIVGISQYWYQAGLGLVILAALAMNRLRVRFVTYLPSGTAGVRS